MLARVWQCPLVAASAMMLELSWKRVFMTVCPYCRQPALVASYDTLGETVAELYSNRLPHRVIYLYITYGEIIYLYPGDI